MEYRACARYRQRPENVEQVKVVGDSSEYYDRMSARHATPGRDSSGVLSGDQRSLPRFSRAFFFFSSHRAV